MKIQGHEDLREWRIFFKGESNSMALTVHVRIFIQECSTEPSANFLNDELADYLRVGGKFIICVAKYKTNKTQLYTKYKLTLTSVTVVPYILKHTIRIDLTEIGVNTSNWVDSTLARNYWKSLASAALNLWRQL